MFLKDPVVNAILIYLVSKAVILSLILAYHWLFMKKRRRSKRQRMPDLRRTAAPRLVLTIQDDNSRTAVKGRQTRTALQQTIEETFSSN